MIIKHKSMLRSLQGFLLLVVSALTLTGCTDMMFADADVLIPEKDPREDIVLTNVQAELTSGGIVQQQISGNQAVFSQASDELIIKDISVTMFSDGNSTRSLTQAELGQIHFADKPELDVGRRDMKFAGDVLYRNPQVNDPTTDSMRLTSELILWDESEQKFKSPMGYEMLLLPKGSAPVRQFGKGFEATQDLSRFVVRTGVVTTELEGDPSREREAMERQFDAWRQEVEEATGNAPDLPKQLEVPPRL